MNVLYLLMQEPDETLATIVGEHKKEHDVTIVDMRKNKNYDEIIDLIASADKVISW